MNADRARRRGTFAVRPPPAQDDKRDCLCVSVSLWRTPLTRGEDPRKPPTLCSVLSFEPELESIRRILGDTLTDALVARERREVVSVQPELRLLAWGGAMLIATAAGIVLKNNVARLGPVVLALLIAVAAAGCYAFVFWRRERASMLDDYVLLLGALLISADVAFVESQFHLLGDVWHRHFLIVAVLHGVTAYVFNSRVLLSLAITALAAWLGVEWNDGVRGGGEMSLRAFTAAAAVLAWRAANRRDAFTRVFEHFTANFAAWGALALLEPDGSRPFGALLAIMIGAAIVWWGFRTRVEAFVLYGFVYAVIGVDALLIDLVENDAFTFFVVALSMIGAIVSLVALHARFRELSE